MSALASPSTAVDEDLDRRRLADLAGQGDSLRWPVLAAVFVVAMLVSPFVPSPVVLGWVAQAVLLREWRAQVLRRLDADVGVPIARRLPRVVWWNVALGLSHGGAAIFMIWLDTTFDALLTMILMSWAAGAVSTAAQLPRAYVAYSTCVFVPTALPWLLGGTPTSLGVAGLIALFALVQFRFMQRNTAIFEESFRIRRENEGLVRELAAARDTAEAANRAKSRFLAAASHDLRQPLHALTLHSGLLAQDPFAADAPTIVAEMSAMIDSLGRLLDSLLDISKLDAGVVKVERRPIRLHRLLANLARSHEPQATEKGLRLRFECPPEGVVETDPLLMERLLRNLLDNALKYTQRGEVSLLAVAGDGPATVSVRDTGRGIPAEALPRVFDEFYQVESGSGRREQGLGLGLAIVQRLAALLQIPLTLESEPGRGTTVTLRLPLVEGRVEPPRPVPAPEAGLQGLKVLVVDDEEAVRRAMRGVLARFGCEAAEAASSADAVARLADFSPDVVLADCHLNDGDSGVEAIRRLREKLPGLPALLISGDTEAERQHEAERSGLRLLHKPVTVVRLRAAMHAALTRQDDPATPHEEA